MVVGNGRMAVMARILQDQSISQSVAEDSGNQKFFAEYIRKEIVEADEPNLLDEEDMHIFGLKPMDDPLHLVCCNACKKPVKASHYAIHADLCRLPSSTRIEKVEQKYKRKQPKKERRKVLSVPANQLAEGSSSRDVTDADDTIPSETQAKPGSISNVAKADNLPHCEEKKPPKNDTQDQAQANVPAPQPYVPAPLATKVYYSRRNDRLREQLGRMFHASDSQQLDRNRPVDATQSVITQSEISLQGSTSSVQKSSTSLVTPTLPQSTAIPKPTHDNTGNVQESQQQKDKDT